MNAAGPRQRQWGLGMPDFVFQEYPKLHIAIFTSDVKSSDVLGQPRMGY